MTLVHVLLPDLVDDVPRPSGGSIYDRRALAGLTSLGWTVREHVVPGPWPWPARDAVRALRAVVERIPDGSTVLVDGIIASATPDVLVPASRRLRLVVVVHLPLGETFPGSGDVATVRRDERAVLEAADAVVVTSAWTRRRVLARYDLDPATVHVAEPGTDRAHPTRSRPDGVRLVQVAPLTAIKGHDVLLDALGRLTDLDWSLRLVGATDLEVAYAASLGPALDTLGDRVSLTGALGRAEVDAVLAETDLLVVPSRTETYGMAATEALARGIPVVASAVGGLPETLRGTGTDDDLPGAVVAPDDAEALAAVLRGWLEDETLRARWRAAARRRRPALHGWDRTALVVADVLADVAHRAQPPEAVAR